MTSATIVDDEITIEVPTTTYITERDHSNLSHLDYASSGHTGFASSTQLTSEATTRETADNLRALITETANKIQLVLDGTNYKISAKLLDKNNNIIYTSNEIDLPSEVAIVSGEYDEDSKSIILTKQSGNTITISLEDLIDGLASETFVSTSISAEATTRQSADTTLQNNINNEATSRANADTSLGNRITTIENDYLKASDKTSLETSISNEATARQNADTQLQTNINNEASSRSSADTTLQNNIDSEESARESADDTLQDNIDEINEKIPNDASSSNQLADKSFVNSSIATNTAYFLGTLDVVNDLELQYQATTSAIATALNNHTFSQTKTNNDYVFVINKDASSNTIYQRFKYVSSTPTFAYEYTLNNSSFTSSQWASINSGITSSKVDKITSNETAISNEATARQSADETLQDNIDAEESRAEGVESGLDTRLDTIEADYLKASDKTALQSQITANANDIDTIEQSSVMQSGIDSTKVAKITSNETAITNITNGTTAVGKSAGYTEDGEIYEALVSLQANITAEATSRANADTTLQTNINAKVNTSDIVDNLTSTDTTKPLSANQGKVLNETKQDKLYLSIVNGMICITYNE